MPTGDNDHPWVVIFGNGYDSRNGKAILYVLDALTGKLIR
jgi:Tfp pilus tip-associated adhesin PilY1